MPATAPSPDSDTNHRPAAGREAGKPWVFFDADNTLWHIEHLYNEARAALRHHLAAQGFDPEAVERLQRQIDHAAFHQLGYAAHRFPQSFVRTLLTLKPGADATEQAGVRRLGESALTATASIDPDAGAVLEAVAREYPIGIVTAGDEGVQTRRVGEFPFLEFFDKIWVVPEKSRSVFERICKEVHADRNRSWMIGDSLRSDIVPAQEAGLQTILLQNPNWNEVEGNGTVPQSTHVVSQLKSVLPLLVG